jgi:hypothetical protein
LIVAKTLRTQIAFDGQRYVDDPVYELISKASACALAVNRAALAISSMRPHAFGAGDAAPAPGIEAPQIMPRIDGLSGYERVHLRWMKRDGKGGLTPRKTP